MAELDALKPDLEKAGERIITERQPYEVSEELKLVSAQLQKLQDLPEDAERIYKDYMGNIEGLKGKLTRAPGEQGADAQRSSRSGRRPGGPRSRT